MRNTCVVTTAAALLFCGSMPSVLGQQKTVTEDKDWSKQTVAMKGSFEAEYVIRAGDVDNLGFGWPEGFDPFCGRMTEAHSYPWAPAKVDQPGLDRILLSSRFKPDADRPCGGDGYSGAYDPVTSKPVALAIPTALLKGAAISPDPPISGPATRIRR